MQMNEGVLNQPRKKKSDKLSAKFVSEPYEIVEKKGNSVVIQSPEKVQY